MARLAGHNKTWYFSSRVLSHPTLPREIAKLGKRWAGLEGEGRERVVVAAASETLDQEIPWIRGGHFQYLVILDVPEQAVPLVIEELGIRRIRGRIHVTRDWGAVRRLLIAQQAGDPYDSIGDAYPLGKSLWILGGDMALHEFPVRRIPFLAQAFDGEPAPFTIDPDGSYLCWPTLDLHCSVSDFLKGPIGLL